MKTANEQIKGILDIIKHKLDVSAYTEKNEYSLNVYDLTDYDDYDAILNKFEWEFGIISIFYYPTPNYHFDDYIIGEDVLMKLAVDEHLTYKFRIDKTFNEFYRQYQHNETGMISTEDIKISRKDYNPKTGVLSVGRFFKVPIAQQGKSNQTINVDTVQCEFMKKLFGDDKLFRNGVSINYYYGISTKKTVDPKKVKSVKNIVTEINKKFKEVTSLEKLLVIKKNHITINEIYLLND